jgi:MobA/MobL family
MAIYHLSASIIKRSAGRSVTAAAAYRAAAKIEDLKTGIIHDYGRKQGVDYSEMISPVSPNSNSSNQWLTNRAELWNKIELIEKRKDAQLAREVTIAIPTELSKPEQIALVREYVNTNYVAAGMIADINLHHLDGDNPHAHILLTMRNLQTSPAGVVEFGLKNTDWNSKELLLAQRKSWEEVANKYLAARGFDARIDCRSLEEQGSPFIPQIHVGVHAMAMKRKGIATDRGEEFDRIEAANNDIRARLEGIYQQEYTEPEPEPKNENERENELGKSLNELLEKWGQRVFHPEDIKLTFYKIKDDQISIYIGANEINNARIYSFKSIDDKWIKTVNPNREYSNQYSVDNITAMVNNQHYRFDTGEIKKLELTPLEHREILGFKDWCGLELNDDRLALIRERGRELISNNLANELVRWIDKNIPSTSEILTKDKIQEILADSSQPVIIKRNDRSDSVYTNYLLLDTQENKILEIRYNRGRLERISGVVTPLISERIKIIVNELEKSEKIIVSTTSNINQQINIPIASLKQESLTLSEIIVVTPDLPIIKLDPIDTNLKPVTSLSTQQPKVNRPKPPNRKPITEGDPRVHLRAMANKTPMPTVDLINKRDLTIETPPITPIPIIQKPETTIVKLPILSEVAVQIEQQQLEHETTEEQRLTSLPENKQVIEKSQAKRKSNRGFER